MPKISNSESLKPFWSTSDGKTVKLYRGDVIDVLKKLPAKSVHCSVTSPPYWGLRDYNTGTWNGGDNDCDHVEGYVRGDTSDEGNKGDALNSGGVPATRQFKNLCKKCGAKRIDQQLGSELSPDCLGWARGVNCAEQDWSTGCHVCRMVLVFRELRRVLRDDGTLWMNYGDSYSSGASTRKAGGGVFAAGRTDGRSGDGGKERWKEGYQYEIPVKGRQNQNHKSSVVHKEGYKNPFRGGTVGANAEGSPYLEQGPMTGGSSGLPAGNLVGIPWRVALALQADGWILRSDVPWIKRSSMPESVQNRPSKALEYVFLFVKKQGYFYDHNAIRMKQKEFIQNSPGPKGHKRVEGTSQVGGFAHKKGGFSEYREENGVNYNPLGRNFRNADLWFESVETPHGMTGVGDEVVGLDVTSESYDAAHFATFGKKLITPLIKAGTSEKGCCAKCGSPWRRVVEEKQIMRDRPNDYVKRTEEGGTGNSCSNSVAGVDTKTIGWEPSCTCHGKFVKKKKVMGYGSYHDHSQDGVEMGLRQGGKGPAIAPIADKEFERMVEEYVPTIPLKDHPVIPCTVLDPFIGSGTTAVVALSLGQRAIGIDLSETYLKNNAIPRIEGALLSRPSMNHLITRSKREVVDLGSEVETE